MHLYMPLPLVLRKHMETLHMKGTPNAGLKLQIIHSEEKFKYYE